MGKLDLTREEAIAVLEYDNLVDHTESERLEYDLESSKRKVATAYCRTGTRQTKPKQETKASPVYQFTERTRKPDATKEGIVAEMANFLANNSQFAVENVAILNPTRELEMKIGESWYKVTLTFNRTKTKSKKQLARAGGKESKL